MYIYIIINVYYIHMIDNICTYNILIISYYIHILKLQHKIKYSISNIQIIHIFVKVYPVLKHNKYVKFFKFQK